jgi:hypothetical protein
VEGRFTSVLNTASLQLQQQQQQQQHDKLQSADGKGELELHVASKQSDGTPQYTVVGKRRSGKLLFNRFFSIVFITCSLCRAQRQRWFVKHQLSRRRRRSGGQHGV